MSGLIIHADDYGLTAGVSEGILEAHARGVVTSTSVLITHATPRELLWLRSEGSLDPGLHCNLTAGAPVRPLSDLPHLISDRGTFAVARVQAPGAAHPSFDFSAVPETELRHELTGQLEAAHAAGLMLTHLDSHHHIHRDPRLFGILLDLAAAHGLGLRTLDAEQRQQCHVRGVPTTGAFLGGWFGAERVTLEHLLGELEAVPQGGAGELMCHPGRNAEPLEALSGYHAPREMELAVLKAPETKAALRERGLRLLSWGDLLPGR